MNKSEKNSKSLEISTQENARNEIVNDKDNVQSKEKNESKTTMQTCFFATKNTNYQWQIAVQSVAKPTQSIVPDTAINATKSAR